MAQPQPATLNLVLGDEDNRLRWGRTYVLPILIEKATSTALNMASGGDIQFTTFRVEVRKKTAAEELVCTGTCVFDSVDGNGTGSDGKVRVTFPSTGWATTGEADATCKWDLVGLTSSNSAYQLVEGDVDVLRTTTEIVTS